MSIANEATVGTIPQTLLCPSERFFHYPKTISEFRAFHSAANRYPPIGSANPLTPHSQGSKL